MPIRWEAVILSTDWEWRHSLARTLDAQGIDCIHATSLQDCKEILSRESVGMIFWDSHLADGGYQEFVQSIPDLDTRVRIVLVSHTDDWDEPLANARKGAFAVIPFPCQPTDVEWALSRANRADVVEGRGEHASDLRLQQHI